MQNIFRNQTVKNLTILDNPLSWVHNSPLVLYTDYHKFSIFLDMSKAVDQIHSKKHTDSYLPQTNIINK